MWDRLDLRFGREEVGAGPHAVETNEAYDLLHIGALRVDRVMLESEDPPDLLDQGQWCTVGCVSQKKRCTSARASLIIRYRQKRLKISVLQS